MIEIALCIFLTYKNGQLAKQKGESTRKWVLISVLAFIMAQTLATLIAVFLSYTGPMDSEAIRKFIFSSPARLLLISVVGFGGILLVRYFIERKKDINTGSENEMP
jgi:hypothetical protein